MRPLAANGAHSTNNGTAGRGARAQADPCVKTRDRNDDSKTAATGVVAARRRKAHVGGACKGAGAT